MPLDPPCSPTGVKGPLPSGGDLSEFYAEAGGANADQEWPSAALLSNTE